MFNKVTARIVLETLRPVGGALETVVNKNHARNLHRNILNNSPKFIYIDLK